MANAKTYEGGEDAFFRDTGKIRRGDIVGVEGHPGKTKKGELSVMPSKVRYKTAGVSNLKFDS